MENLNIIITFVTYLPFLLAVGSPFYQTRNESRSDYLIGGGLIVSVLLIVLFSKLDKEPAPSITTRFDLATGK